MKLLELPGEVTFRVLLAIGVPFPFTPIWLTGDGLQVPGAQTAYTALEPAKVEVIDPALLTPMVRWSVDV
jgi:hypothetical protein